ncbi:hypothetical protein BGZ49_000231 [Haplosporangium sp. Z 27]|nr:hypothetical protein BGZ49_000231 [Haplosporangium sp. Z 27]
MAEELVVHFEKLLTRVDGLLSAVVTDRDGVVLLRANAPNVTPPFTESALGCTFALASDQASKLGLKKNKSIVSIYGSYQLVQFNHSSLITTFVANSNANTVGIPIFGVGFTQEDNLILCGGGGAGGTGVQNKISIYKINKVSKVLDLIVESKLGHDEDAPMSLCVHPKEPVLACGINSNVKKIEEGDNENCRIFKYSNTEIRCVNSKGTLASRSPADYQRVVSFNKDGSTLATGGTDGVVAVLNYPDLSATLHATQFKGHSILDVDFSADGEHLAAVSCQNLWIISAKTGRVLEVITNPVLHKKKPFEFRKCRFGKGLFSSTLYTIVNGDKNQKPFVCKWDTRTWTRSRTSTVGSKPITSCTVSPDGKLIAFGSADLSIRICSSQSLKVLVTIINAHALPVTALAFNSDSTLLVSGSVDATCNVISVPKTFPRNNNFVMLVMALLFLFLAGVIQVYQSYRL